MHWVLIFKIFVCSVLNLQRTVWTLDLKCSQQQKCKYLLWPLFRMPHASWVLCITFAFINCHSLLFFFFVFCLYMVSLLCYHCSFYIIILSKKKKKNLFPVLLYSFFFLITTFIIFSRFLDNVLIFFSMCWFTNEKIKLMS